MNKAKKNIEVKQSFKKNLKKEITFQLANNLEDLRTMLGEKKFNRRILKASKLLSSGIKMKKVDTLSTALLVATTAVPANQ